jgi:hypothetical protein
MHYSAAYASYRQGSCTITDKQVQEDDTTDKYGNVISRSYAPVLSYTVHTANDGLAFASGFDGPTSMEYDASDEAQAIIDHYTIDQRVACWYNPGSPSHAFIVFYGYNSSDALDTFFIGILCLSIFAIIVYFLFDWTVWRLYALAKRGVLVYGSVVRQKVLSSRSGKHIVSVVGFRAAEEATKERYITLSKQLPIGRQVCVCYDPFYPRYRRHDNWPTRKAYIPGAVFIGVLIVIAMIVMIALWLVP